MNRVRLWWRLAVAIAAAVSYPRVDVAHADDGVEAAVLGSRLWHTGETVATALAAAWFDSRCRRLVVAAAGGRR